MKRYLFVLALFPLFLMTVSCEREEEEENQAVTVTEAESQAVTVTEEEPGLLSQASISPDSAIALARAQVPGAHISKAEIENEDGRLIYSFDMTPGIAQNEEARESEEAEGAEAAEEREEAGEAEEAGEGSETEEAEEGTAMITEVHVDALTGEILSVEQENAAESSSESGGEAGEGGGEAGEGGGD